jgi:hypothetical protein
MDWLQDVLGETAGLMRGLGMLPVRNLGILIEGNFLVKTNCALR